MIQTKAEQFASDWMEAWNSHNLEVIMKHYDEKVEFISPFIVILSGNPNGTIKGKAALKDYFEIGLQKYPQLHFKLHQVFTGVQSVTLYYESVNKLMAAETMELSSAGLVKRVIAAYAPL